MDSDSRAFRTDDGVITGSIVGLRCCGNALPQRKGNSLQVGFSFENGKAQVLAGEPFIEIVVLDSLSLAECFVMMKLPIKLTWVLRREEYSDIADYFFCCSASLPR